MQFATRTSARLLIAIAIFVLAASTLLLTRSPQSAAFSAESRPALAPFAAIITLPLPMPTASELRNFVLPVALAAALLLLAVTADSHPTLRAPRWFEICAVAAAAIAVLSAFVNQAWDLSHGWIFFFVAGAGWAALLARRATPRTVAFVLAGAAIVACGACVLSLVHRQILGIQFVRWPVGPIAVSSELAAVWAAAAAGCLVGLVASRPAIAPRSRNFAIAGALLTAFAALALLRATERVAPAIALLIAVAWAIVLPWSSHPARRRIIVAAVAALALGGAIFGFAHRADRAGSLSVRLAYWNTIFHRFPSWAALGVGPDLFVVTSTNDLARARAETPHPLHGTLERSAHNEWLQACFELGLVGGLLYAVLPLGALAAAYRAFPRATAETRMMLATTSTGLVALIVAEAANVNLRYGTVPGWYWTLIGLTLALAGSTRAPRPAPAWLPRRTILRLAAAGLAVAVLLITLTDGAAAYAQARGEATLATDDVAAARWFTLATPRLGAEQWLKTRAGLATAASNLARSTLIAPPVESSDSMKAARQAAAAAWTEIYQRCPGYHGDGGSLAEAQFMSGDPKLAEATLNRYLSEVDPYDASANALFARTFTHDDSATLDALARAARSAGFDNDSAQLLRTAATSPDEHAIWNNRVAAAEADVRLPEKDWKDPLAPETLRLEAARLSAAGDRASAARLGKLAADAYFKLYTENNPRRRPAEAEADAFARAAEDLFRSDPSQYQAAYELICNAERFAVLGGELEQLRNPDPNAEFVGGQVVPTDLPEIYRPLWRLSALLHLAAGRVQNIELRIRSSLPEDHWSQAEVDAVWVALARELVDAFAKLPPDRRPSHYDRLVRLASTAATRPANQRP